MGSDKEQGRHRWLGLGLAGIEAVGPSLEGGIFVGGLCLSVLEAGEPDIRLLMCLGTDEGPFGLQIATVSSHDREHPGLFSTGALFL